MRDFDLIGLTELCEILEREYGVKRKRVTIQRAARLGNIPAVHPGREYLVRRSDAPKIAAIFQRHPS